MIFKRDIFPKIEHLMGSREAIVITGPRRAGKSTVLQYFFDKIESANKIFLDLENPLNQGYFDEVNYDKIKVTLSEKGIDFGKKSYVFLDEIQFVKNAPSVIKYLYDHNDIKFLVSGSASFYLKNLFSESMSGRKFILELFPLKFSEFLRFKGLERLKPPALGEKVSPATYEFFQPFYEEFFIYGGFPQVVLKTSSGDKLASLEEVFSSYFNKEIVQLSDFKDNSLLRKFILLLTERVGQKLDIQKTSSELGVSRPTLYSFLEYLQGTYLINLVYPFGKVDIASRKQPKVYFNDSGLLNYLGKVDKGSLFENAVYCKLKQECKEIGYYLKEGREIDFICDGKVAFEVKNYAGVSDAKKLINLSKKLGIKENSVFSYKFSDDGKVVYGFSSAC